MRRIAERELRSLVRQIIAEAAGTPETVAVTNFLRTKITVTEVTSASEEEAPNLISSPVEIGPGETQNVTFTPRTEDKNFLFVSKREQGTGVTKGYRRDALVSFYGLGQGKRSDGLVTYDSLKGRGSLDIGEGYKAEFEDVSDTEEMTADEIGPLVQAGEKYEIVEDPTDPEFSYAVFYRIVPTRAVVVRAPLADYKGEKLVTSRGQEISPRRYSRSFKVVADALLAKMQG